MKVAIIGAGIVGLTVAWALTRLGHQIIVLEQGAIPNPASASFDQHRMIRPHYGDQRGYTQMVEEAHGDWELLWDDLGICHYAETGVLAVDLGDHGWMRASESALKATNTSYEVVDWRGIERHAPALVVGQDAWGLFTPRAGILFADRILTDLSKWLENNGVELRQNALVSDLDASKGLIAIEDGDELEAEGIVVAAGAWTSRLPLEAGARVTPVRSVVGYVMPPDQLAAAWAGSPALFLATKGAHLYCLPPVCGTELKFGGAPNLRPGDPDVPQGITSTDLSEIGQAFAPHLKDPKRHQIVRGAAGYYADPADKRFIVEACGKVIVVTGCGGRMFKFGALIGRRIAQYLHEGLNIDQLTEWARGGTARESGLPWSRGGPSR